MVFEKDDINNGWDTLGGIGCIPDLTFENFNEIPEPFISPNQQLRLLKQNWYRGRAVDAYRRNMYGESYKLFLKNVRENRDIRSMTCLGFILFNGQGCKTNQKLGIECWIRASEKGDHYADKMLTVYYEFFFLDRCRASWYYARSKYLPPFNIRKEWGFDHQ